MRIKKNNIDDGMNPELVRGTDFDGVLGVPIMHAPEKIIIPRRIVPFSKRKYAIEKYDAIGFFEMDQEFADVLAHPEKYIDEFKDKIILSPDCSLYRNAPLIPQMANVYRNRSIGSYFQRNGIYVIPHVRWGNSFTYTDEILPEKVAFLGIEKHSIVSIGTYGCFKTTDDKKEFERGLSAMLDEIEPKVVLVYGSMNKKVFGKYFHRSKFIQYKDWITMQKGGDV